MREPDLSSTVEIIKRMAAREFGAEVENRQVEDILREVLHEPRNLLRAAESGLVTESEVAAAVAAHVHRWLMDASGRSWQEQSTRNWDDFISKLEASLFSPK